MELLQNTERYPFTPNFLECDGNKLAYLDEGPKDKPVVIMLHGNPSWSYLYRNLVHLLGFFEGTVSMEFALLTSHQFQK